MYRVLLTIWCAGYLTLHLAAQPVNSFHIKGNAVNRAFCNDVLFAATPNSLTHTMYSRGAAWYLHPLDLNEPFEMGMVVEIYKTIATDGMTFVLCPDTAALGSHERQMGWGGIRQSFAVTLDTRQEAMDNDPPFNHLAIQLNGITDHASPGNIAGPVPFFPDVEEGLISQYLVFKWEPLSRRFSVHAGNQVLLTAEVDLVNAVFGGNSRVHWGFTATQTQLTDLSHIPPDARPPLGFLRANFGTIVPRISSQPELDTCYGQPIRFFDQSLYIAEQQFNSSALAKWYWDFGDGTFSRERNPPPHQYPGPGEYLLKFAVTNQVGCTVDTLFQQFRLSATPVADFSVSAACSGVPVKFTDRSTVRFSEGIYNWWWDFNGEITSREQAPVVELSGVGVKNISLTVQSAEGCRAQVSRPVVFEQAPRVDFSSVVDCERTIDAAVSVRNGIPVRDWHWNFGDGATVAGNPVQHTYLSNGRYPASVYAVSQAGCISDTVTRFLTVSKLLPFAGADTVAVRNTPLQLQATGADFYRWQPADGLSNPRIANPVAVLQEPVKQYVVEFGNALGCVAYDTIVIRVFDEPGVFIPRAFTPNGDGLNDVLRSIAPGFGQVAYFMLYNRSGKAVYSVLNGTVNWDGTFKGEPQPPGTYVWVLRISGSTGEVYTKKGIVVLLR